MDDCGGTLASWAWFVFISIHLITHGRINYADMHISFVQLLEAELAPIRSDSFLLLRQRINAKACPPYLIS
jgi:hypothetical protein